MASVIETAQKGARDGTEEDNSHSSTLPSLAPTMKLNKSGFGVDLLRVLSRPGYLPMYKHCVPRTPARLLDKVVKSRRVQTAVVRLSKARGVDESVVQKEALKVVNTMGHNLGMRAIRVMGYILQKVLRATYEEVRVNEKELTAVKEAIKNGPLLVLPNHRSYMDFLIVSYLFFFAGVPVPAIAAGEDFLALGPVSWLLRGCGAFFMRRSFAEDPLYWACFSEYVIEIVGNGDQPLEFFIEGTRSRTGKCLHPKVGLMGAALRPFFEGRVNEINILPIAVTYEERMETHLYADEMLGTPKPKESFGKVLKARNVMKHNHGRMHVKLGPIISAQDFLAKRVSRARHTMSPGPTPYNANDRAAVVDLSYKVLEAHQRGFVITVPVILASLSLCWSQSGIQRIPISQVICDCERVYQEVRARGYSADVVPRGTTTAVTVAAALEEGLGYWMVPLQPAVELCGDEVVLKLSATDPSFNGILLAHLRNEMLHVFVPEALILTSALSISHTGCTESALYSRFVFLHKLLYKEVILRFSSEGDRRVCFEAAIARLLASGTLSQNDCGRFDASMSGSAGTLSRLFVSLINPFIEAYENALSWCLANLSNMKLDNLVTELRNFTAQERPNISADSLSSETIKNAISTFRAMGMLGVEEGRYYTRIDEKGASSHSTLVEIASRIRERTCSENILSKL